MPNPARPRADIEQAAKDAQVHDVYCRATHSAMDTIVGERGLKAVRRGKAAGCDCANAFEKIRILDEATSALDSATERDIQAALDRIANGAAQHWLSPIDCPPSLALTKYW